MYYAHSKESPENQSIKDYQPLKTHLYNTAELARGKAAKFNASEFGYLCGLLHDVGKYSSKFQKKLTGEKISVNHTGACGDLAIKLYSEGIGKLIAYIVTGHHTGLKDCGTKASAGDGTLHSRLNEVIEDYSDYINEINIEKQPLYLPFKQNNSTEDLGYSISFFIRMLFSCLVDSDFIDTETFINGERPRGNYDDIGTLSDRFDIFLNSLKFKEQTTLNINRAQILNRCIDYSQKEQGLYSLTVPTGGGKTFSSLAFALKHAQKHNLDRIIYVIPYTSIIEQTADVFKTQLGNDCVLEHHSNFAIEFDKDKDRIKLATENWDIPIIVTTNVQFFESLYANRSSKCRKLHNVSKSVVIFDEAQMLPIEYLKCCIKAISELVRNYKVTAVLCTATQPPFEMFLDENVKIEEIIADKEKLYLDFKKVEIIKRGLMDNDTLLSELNRLNQVLCIVNTKKHAKEIYDGLQGVKFHLSTNMCAKHRRIVLEEIKQKLNNGEQCRVVSTQLIECGVDIDFPVVYRSMAGLDSIIQSAGRCNREGTLATGHVNVFEPSDEIGKIKGYIERCAKVTQEIFRNFDDVLSIEAIKRYFELLYFIEGEENLDRKNILNCFDTPLDFDFEKAADSFKLIETNTQAIIVPFDKDAIKIINEAKFSKYPMSAMRKLQLYSVNLHSAQFNALNRDGCIELVNNTFFVLKDFDKSYDKDTGIIIRNNTYGDGIFA